MVSPKITSVNQHSYEIGRIAAKTFLEFEDKDQLNQTLKKNILEAELIVRASSKRK